MTEKFKLIKNEPYIENTETGECYDLDSDNFSYIVKIMNDLSNENKKLKQENEQLEQKVNFYKDFQKDARELEKENEKLKQSINEIIELLSEEVDLFSDKATEHDINAYVELNELDNKDAFYMATATKKAIKMLKELKE